MTSLRAMRKSGATSGRALGDSTGTADWRARHPYGGRPSRHHGTRPGVSPMYSASIAPWDFWGSYSMSKLCSSTGMGIPLRVIAMSSVGS
jgi:hypothetical protein